MRKIYLLIILVSVASTAMFAQLGAGLVSQYYFSGNANDMVGTNNGIVRGATLAPDRFGNANAAYCYNGVNNLINLGTSPTLKTGTMSISLWAKITSYTNTTGSSYQNQPFIATRSNTAINTYEAYFVGMYIPTSGLDAATTSTSGVQNAILSTFTSSINVWNHLVYMFNNDTTWLYVNGVFQQKVYKGFTSGYLATDSVTLGYVGSGASYSWLNGCIDDLRIYNRLLTPQDIVALYNEPSNPQGINYLFKNENIFKIYPNPSGGKFKIGLTDGFEGGLYKINVINTLGQKIFETNTALLKQNDFELNLGGFEKGIYFVELLNGNEKEIQKIIIK